MWQLQFSVELEALDLAKSGPCRVNLAWAKTKRLTIGRASSLYMFCDKALANGIIVRWFDVAWHARSDLRSGNIATILQKHIAPEPLIK